MTDKISVNREHPRGTVSQNNAKAPHRKEDNKNNLWRIIFKERKNRIKNTDRKIERKAPGKTFKDTKKVKNEQTIENFAPDSREIRTIQLPNEKNLLPVATNLVKNIYTGLSASGNRELVLSMMPSIFRDTHIRVEKTGKARVRIIIDSEDAFALNFFNKFYENIKAGLVMRGLVIDEFKIKR